ncbi:MAG: glycosyltransferase family A protein [Nitrososphaera sp.]|jgi:glycosyltransferase involved in cell wall biosynthesis
MAQNLGTYYCFFPVRDGERTVAQVMESLLAQTHRPSKIIAVNDGSADRTGEILDQYQKKHPGLVEVINTGSTTRDYKRIPLLWNMSLRKGYDYHMIAAGDVSFAPDYAEKILLAMKDREMVICSGDYGGARSVAPHGAGRFVRQSFFFDNYDQYPHVVGYESEILERALLQGKKISVVHDATFDHLDRLGHSHNFVEFGYAMKALGYYAPYVLGRCVKEFVRNGQVGRRGAWNMFYYYMTFKPKPEGYFSLFPEDLRRGIRERQKKMVRRVILKKLVPALKG